MPGVRWCATCDRTVARLLRRDGHGWVDRPAVELPTTWVHATYAGPVRGAIPAFKDGRRDLLDPLAALLRASLVGMLRHDPDLVAAAAERRLLVVTAPSRPAAVRERGCVPVRDLVRAAWSPRVLPLAPARALRVARGVADQGGLSAYRRAANLDGLFRATGVDGWHCLLVDDVVTTGATLAEGMRALRAVGATDVTGLAVAATVLRHRT